MDASLALALGLLAADYSQTSYIASHTEHTHCVEMYRTQAGSPPQPFTRVDHIEDRHEMNPLLGRRPSQAKVALYFAGAAAAVTVAHYRLPKPYGDVVTYAVIATEGITVGRNVALGVRFNF